MRTRIRLLPLLFFLFAAAYAQHSRQDIDQIATQALTETGVPSASVSIVENGKVSYEHAYGEARLDPKKPAEPQMRYPIGSISKQFTATAIDRKSTRLNSSHGYISYAVFCFKKN